MQNLKKPENKTDGYKAYVKYSSLGFEIVAIILIFLFAGFKLDSFFNISSHLLTIVFTLVGLVLSMLYLVRKLSK